MCWRLAEINPMMSYFVLTETFRGEKSANKVDFRDVTELSSNISVIIQLGSHNWMTFDGLMA